MFMNYERDLILFIFSFYLCLLRKQELEILTEAN